MRAGSPKRVGTSGQLVEDEPAGSDEASSTSALAIGASSAADER
jgi:hypothetical protein